MKRFITALVLASSINTVNAQEFFGYSGFSMGVFLGEPDSGVSLATQQFQVHVGLADLSLAVDATFNFGDALARPELWPFYSYMGVKWQDDKENTFGPRAGLGVYYPVQGNNLTFYAQGGPAWYMVDEAEVDWEGVVGMRVHF